MDGLIESTFQKERKEKNVFPEEPLIIHAPLRGQPTL